jgi:LPXTG-motif cell wall-anchored protein
VATINVAVGEHVTCTFTNTKHGVYGNDPAVNPVENPYVPVTNPNPGGQPAGDTGQPGATTPDPGTQVAGTTETAPVADPGTPVLQGVVSAVEGQVNLPRTGAEIVQQALAGLILIGAGLVLLALRRRRSSSPSA